MAAVPTICDFGWKAVDFALEGVDGETHTLERVRGPKGTLVMFICNHCPYVKSVIGRISQEAAALQALGIDLRRSAVRNLDRSGVSPKIATAISGHKTRSVYERYNIVADRDLEDAAEKLNRYLKQRQEASEGEVSRPAH